MAAGSQDSTGRKSEARDPLTPELTLGVPAHSANLRQPPSSWCDAQQAGMVMEGRES